MDDLAKPAKLKDVVAELGVSYRAAWSAAQKGRLPAVQPFGKGTAWYVVKNYQDFLCKAAAQHENDEQ